MDKTATQQERLEGTHKSRDHPRQEESVWTLERSATSLEGKCEQDHRTKRLPGIMLEQR